MHQISSDSDDARSFNELKNKMSSEAKEQVDAKVEVMMAELGHLDKLVTSETEVDKTNRGTQISSVQRSRSMPDHSSLRAQSPRLNNSNANLLRDDRDKR